MRAVFILQHEYEQWGKDEAKLIGVYRSRDEAESAISRLRDKPGFSHWPDGFTIDECSLGEDNWTEGFSTLVAIHVEFTANSEKRWECVQAEWLPGDVYRIIESESDSHVERWAFKPGQVVRCDEQTVEGNPGCLVAVSLMEKDV
jgi:hypothetical protein